MIYETLHLSHSIKLRNLSAYTELIGTHDAVVFYLETIDADEYQNIKSILNPIKTYFIIEKNINSLPSISYDEWLDLVNQYNKTFTWK